MTDKRSAGLYGKFVVSRRDGADAMGQKHERCAYFVLDATHDPHAAVALRAYATSCRADGYAALADDLDALARRAPVNFRVAPPQENAGT